MPDVAEAQPKRRPPKAAYALPTFFTAGNIFLGYLAIVRTIQGVQLYAADHAAAAQHFEFAAQMIGLSVLADGLDGRVARMTHTTSDFGRELDSLADIISFGIAPAILAYAWGVMFVTGSTFSGPWGVATLDQLQRAGKFVAFLFLLCGAGRLARFNIQKNPVPKNPGAPGRKYFVGLAIPAAASMVAAVVYFFDAYPVTNFAVSIVWQALLALLGFLMISTWRYWSFKEINLNRPRSFAILVSIGAVMYAIVNWSKPVLLALAIFYVSSGIAIRIGGIIKRRVRAAAAKTATGAGSV